MSLLSFAKQHCCNADNGNCLLRDKVKELPGGVVVAVQTPCVLSVGQACDYFKASVWPICDPAYRFSTHRKEYERNLSEFRLVYGESVAQSVRKCECGEVLKKRQRLCEKCRRKNRRKTWNSQKSKTGG